MLRALSNEPQVRMREQSCVSHSMAQQHELVVHSQPRKKRKPKKEQNVKKRMQPQDLQAAGVIPPNRSPCSWSPGPQGWACISLAAGQLTAGSSRAAVGAEANSAPCWLRQPAGSSGSSRPRDGSRGLALAEARLHCSRPWEKRGPATSEALLPHRVSHGS